MKVQNTQYKHYDDTQYKNYDNFPQFTHYQFRRNKSKSKSTLMYRLLLVINKSKLGLMF